MPPAQSKIDSRAATLLLKKHKTTVLLMIQPHETLDYLKEILLQALKSRALNEINGESVPDDSFDIELGVPVDRADLEKGWRSLETDLAELANEGAQTKNKGKAKKESPTILETGIQSGHTLAFRFRKNEGQSHDQIDLVTEDPGWDVIIPSYDDEEM
ncbi:unnamed protein product [Penicillium salamii]|uniref:Uncharacterized protein n=1 Tax=Penicillium salamii TaxID=1612424 RepID=A0A9W4I795_9EURO|nr:unnamed protein product [Penicillium salamii]CAG7969150.1 unnamed protein product [Penicillium salamii]CAG8039961.1 unnamed protein product [Penicillium salamii]CAG8066975.1 unnamed protein product [Penicillium salamii]CAG8161676.1 unnamed protein product [Penicillium salamii]